MQEVEIDIDKIFTVPELEIYDITAIVHRIKQAIEDVEVGGDKHVEYFSNFFEHVYQTFKIKVTDDARKIVMLTHDHKKGKDFEIYIYRWSGRSGTYCLAIDLQKKCLGFWDPAKTGKQLTIWS